MFGVFLLVMMDGWMELEIKAKEKERWFLHLTESVALSRIGEKFVLALMGCHLTSWY